MRQTRNSGKQLWLIQRAFYTQFVLSDDRRIYHGCFNIRMPQELLYRPDIIKDQITCCQYTRKLAVNRKPWHSAFGKWFRMLDLSSIK
jgi:hypothetical protein